MESPKTEHSYRASVRHRLGALEGRARRQPHVRSLLSILDAYNAAGGGMLAAGIAYSAVLAVISGLLMVVSLVTILVVEGDLRLSTIHWMVDQLPPLQSVAVSIVDGLADGARAGAILGLLGFVWGASGFYQALEGAMGRLFPGRRSRNPYLSRVRGMLAVLVLVAGVLSTFVLGGVLTVLSTLFKTPLDIVMPLISPLVAIAAATGIAFIVYRIVPSDPPGWRAAMLPALLAGMGIGLLTTLFTALPPFLVGNFAGLGVTASVFIAMIWFSYVFQILLYGAAFARLRRDRDYTRFPPATWLARQVHSRGPEPRVTSHQQMLRSGLPDPASPEVTEHGEDDDDDHDHDDDGFDTHGRSPLLKQAAWEEPREQSTL